VKTGDSVKIVAKGHELEGKRATIDEAYQQDGEEVYRVTGHWNDPACTSYAWPFRASELLPLNTREEILDAWDRAEISEGFATNALGVDMVDARAMLIVWREKKPTKQSYRVQTCGTTRDFTASSPEEAAALMLQDHHWRGTRSIMVRDGSQWIDFLDCELVEGKLQFVSRDVYA
jgi:hypothetical protein